jgi:hypothetical protein
VKPTAKPAAKNKQMKQ